jgi:tRNA(His) guanylyltransferase
MTDTLGDRMKLYESAEDRRFMPLLPVIARLDGKGFHSYCRGLGRPYDPRLSSLMLRTTAHLVRETGARVGYTQSDEISLLFYSDDPKSQIYFDGRVQKMVSVLSATTSVFFNRQVAEALPEKADVVALFDCRVWSVPTKDEAANAFLWRELDATKNSISMAASAVYSHTQLMGKHSGAKLDMLIERGVNWNDYPDFFKRGSYVQRRRTLKAFSVEELARLPEKHEARLNPSLMIERSIVAELAMPRLTSVTNRVAVLFDGATPETAPVESERQQRSESEVA